VPKALQEASFVGEGNEFGKDGAKADAVNRVGTKPCCSSEDDNPGKTEKPRTALRFIESVANHVPFLNRAFLRGKLRAKLIGHQEICDDVRCYTCG